MSPAEFAAAAPEPNGGGVELRSYKPDGSVDRAFGKHGVRFREVQSKFRTKVCPVSQKPLELILARNLMSALSTPAFLVDEGGLLAFYNEAAGTLLGKGFDEVGHVGPNEWGGLFGPYDAAGETIPYDDLPMVQAVRAGRPAHATFGVRAFDGRVHAVECSAFPILTPHGSQGAIAILWPVEEGLPGEAVTAMRAAATSATVPTGGDPAAANGATTRPHGTSA